MLVGQKNNQINKEFKEELVNFLEEKIRSSNEKISLLNDPASEIFLNQFCLAQKLINEINKEYPSYPEQPYLVDTIDRISYACPSQWLGKTKCGKEIYCRYRGGKFSLEINDELIHHVRLRNDPEISLEEFLKKEDDKDIEQKINYWKLEHYFRKINGNGHSYHGLLSNEEMMEVTKGFLDFSQSFTNFEEKIEPTPGIINAFFEDIKNEQ